jgi:hypothetical protein
MAASGLEVIYNKTIYGIEAIPEPDMTSYRLF